MANTYCTATNTGKDFFTHEDRNNFYLSQHQGPGLSGQQWKADLGCRS